MKGKPSLHHDRATPRAVAAALLAALVCILAALPTLAQDEDASEPVRPNVAFSARLAGDDARARIVIGFEAAPDYRLRYLAAPPRIVVDMDETAFAFPPDAFDRRGLVRDVRYGKSGEARARIVFGLSGPAKVELAEVQADEAGNGVRLVLDVASVGGDEFARLAAESDWHGAVKGERAGGHSRPEGKPFTVVIDAGHGGIDSGARGVKGSMEKEVTLAFAQALEDALDDLGGIKVVQTRSDDSFISLTGRLRIAHEAGADLFLSIHADSISVRRLRGATVYTLSDRASDAVAQSLVDQENREEGMIGHTLESAPEAVAGVLIDLARNETRVFSNGLAEKIVTSFEGQVQLINNPHRKAGFRVLQAPDVPAALVELGYLSNAEDEKLLTDAGWREKTAALLAKSIETYRGAILAAAQ